MSKIDFSTLPRPVREKTVITLQCPDDDNVLQITVQPLGLAQSLAAESMATDLHSEYGTTGYVPPQGGDPIPVSMSLAQSVAVLTCMQCPNIHGVYSAEDFIVLADVLPEVMAELMQRCTTIQNAFSSKKK